MVKLSAPHNSTTERRVKMRWHYAFLAGVILLFATTAHAQLYNERWQPVLGELQDPPVTFCLTERDIVRLVQANITNHAAEAWKKMVDEGKCGVAQIPFYYSRVISTAFKGRQVLYVMELRLKLKDWPKVYAFGHVRPSGMQEAQLSGDSGQLLLVDDPHHQHPDDLPIHEKFYSTWYMPDNPQRSCCNIQFCDTMETWSPGSQLLIGRGYMR